MSVSQSYAARRVDRNGLTHRSIPDAGVMYKSGYFTVAAHMLKNTTSYFRNPFTSRSTYSPHIPACSRLNRSRDECKCIGWSSGDLRALPNKSIWRCTSMSEAALQRARCKTAVFGTREIKEGGLEGRKSDEEHDGMRNSTFGHFGTRKVILAKLLHHGSKTNLN